MCVSVCPYLGLFTRDSGRLQIKGTEMDMISSVIILEVVSNSITCRKRNLDLTEACPCWKILPVPVRKTQVNLEV